MAYDNKSCRCVIASVRVDKTLVTVAEKEILASGYNTSVRVVTLILQLIRYQTYTGETTGVHRSLYIGMQIILIYRKLVMFNRSFIRETVKSFEVLTF